MRTRTKDGKKRPSPKGYWTKAEHDARLTKKRALRERQKSFAKAKPLPPEDKLREMISAHMELHGVIVCPPAYLAPTRALDLRPSSETTTKPPKRKR